MEGCIDGFFRCWIFFYCAYAYACQSSSEIIRCDLLSSVCYLMLNVSSLFFLLQLLGKHVFGLKKRLYVVCCIFLFYLDTLYSRMPNMLFAEPFTFPLISYYFLVLGAYFSTWLIWFKFKLCNGKSINTVLIFLSFWSCVSISRISTNQVPLSITKIT